MKDISLKDLLEAGCHFGHKTSKWHPKAAQFIFQKKEGIHIIDLAKTKAGLVSASEYVKTLGTEGKVMMVIATKRQAKSIVVEAARNAGLPYMTSRWVGGFLTNWEEVKKNIDKINNMKQDKVDGKWKKFPKHEQVKMDKYIKQLEITYGGVRDLIAPPDALFIIDIKKEEIAVKEAIRKNVPIVGIVDTNSDPNLVNYVIPANDDAVGSVQYLVNYITQSYAEGAEIFKKRMEKETAKQQAVKAVLLVKPEITKQAETSKIDEVKKSVVKKVDREEVMKAMKLVPQKEVIIEKAKPEKKAVKTKKGKKS
jgi:small subunit ribosomal protein S2